MKAAAKGRNGLHDLNKTALTAREMDSYFTRHPGSPAAVRRPHLYLAGATFVALLNRSVEEGIVGLGMTIGAAFRAFDFQYLRKLRPADTKLESAEPALLDRTSRSGFPATPAASPIMNNRTFREGRSKGIMSDHSTTASKTPLLVRIAADHGGYESEEYLVENCAEPVMQ